MDLDVAWVRAQFPALDPAFALFDNAGGSLPARPVTERIGAYLAEDMVQLGASYPRSRRASARVSGAHAAAAALVAGDADGVVLGASTTMVLYVLSHACAEHVGAGDEIVVTDLDHEANRGAWARLARARGATVREWRSEAGALTLRGLEEVLGARTKIVAFAHVSNVVGAVHDAATFCARIRASGALSVVDGVAFAPHRHVDVQALGADVYALSLYKVFGPHLGMLHVRPALFSTLANQNHAFLAGRGSYTLMPGNVSHELAAGVVGITEYLAALDLHHGGEGTVAAAFARIAEYEATLVAPLLAMLHAHPRVRVLGPGPGSARVPTVAFTVEGTSSEAVVTHLEGQRLAGRHGHFYAQRAMEVLGVPVEDGVARISLAHYNAPSEVERLCEVLATLLGGG